MDLHGKPFELKQRQIKWVENTLTEMTTEEKIGQLFCVLGDAYEEKELNQLVKDYAIGGVLFRPDAAVGDELPASQSKELLTGVLREQFGFEGLIITDATIMGGYTMSMPRSRAIPGTIQAGCDMICFATDIYEDLRYMKEGLARGLLTEERLNEAVMRVLALKAKVTAAQEETEEIPAKEWSRECADKAITLVKDIQSLVPVKVSGYSKIKLVILGEDQMFDGSMKETAIKTLRDNGFEVELYEPFMDDLHGCGNLPDDRFTLILANCPTASNNTTVRIQWCPKHALEIPRFINEEKSVFISFANPYHLQDVPRVRTYINAYSAIATTVQMSIEKLIGKSEFKGISPVDAFCGLADTHC